MNIFLAILLSTFAQASKIEALAADKAAEKEEEEFVAASQAGKVSFPRPRAQGPGVDPLGCPGSFAGPHHPAGNRVLLTAAAAAAPSSRGDGGDLR